MLSLLNYFSKTAIDHLSRFIYNCIFKLFNINCANKTQVQIDQLLSGYNLTSLQFRIFFKFSTFAFQAKYAPNSPLNLKALLEENSSLYSYNIRNSTKLYMQPTKVKTEFGLSTFKNLYCTFFNKNKQLVNVFKNNNFLNFSKFKQSLINNKENLLSIFLTTFPKFQISSSLNLYDAKQAKNELNTAFYKKSKK